MGRLCGGAHEISGIKTPLFLHGGWFEGSWGGWVVVGSVVWVGGWWWGGSWVGWGWGVMGGWVVCGGVVGPHDTHPFSM